MELGRRPWAIQTFVAITLLFVVTTNAAPSPGCKEYFSKGQRIPAIEALNDTISVVDAFPVGSVSLTVDVSHRRIGALVISLTAQPAVSAAPGETRMVVVKERGLGRLGDNMYMSTFADTAERAFPVQATNAPFMGTFKPTQRLSFLYDDATPSTKLAGVGGSQGDWVLRIVDVAPNATIRPIALNGWKLTLCPAKFDNVALPSTPVPSPPALALIPQQAPAPAPAPAINGFEGPSPSTTVAAPQRPPEPRNFLGWKVVWNDQQASAAAPNAEPEVSAMEGTSQQPQQTKETTQVASPVLPPTDPMAFNYGLGNVYRQQMMQRVANFKASFDAYLQSMFGPSCIDAQCSNIKSKFGAAALGLAYMKAAKSGKIQADKLMAKLADLLPGPNPLLGKFSEGFKDWADKKDDIMIGLSQWYDRWQANLATDSEGVMAMLSQAMQNGDGLKALGLDNQAMAQALMPMWKSLGLDSPDDAKALLDGLQEAGFDGLMKEFMGEIQLPQGEGLSGLLGMGMGGGTEGLPDWQELMTMFTDAMRR